MLELKSLVLDERGQAKLSYSVRHNVGRLKTTLEQILDVALDTRTGKVEAELHLTELQADSLDAARAKMAFWCERMAAALRGGERRAGELPLYERRAFHFDQQPAWLQDAYTQLVKAKLAATTEEDFTAIEQWLDGHPMVLVYGLMDAVESEVCRAQENENAPNN